MTSTDTIPATENIEATDAMTTTTVEEDHPVVLDEQLSPAGPRHRHRRAPSRRRGPVRLLLGIVRLPGRLVRTLRPSRLPWYGALAVGALIVAALVIDGLWWQSNRRHEALNSARGDALVAATSAAQKVLSFDYRTMSADVARAKATATGPFLTQYEQASASLVKEVGPAKAIVQASVQSGSVVNASHGQITVLLFVDQASVRQDSGQKTPVTRIDQARVQMTMVKQHGRWLVAQLTSL
jgi:Mce-associated membrane protein